MDADIHNVLVTRLRAVGASPADAEDCAQEALLEAWSGAAAGRVLADPVAWMTVVARNKYVDLVRRRSRETTVGLVPAQPADRTAVGPEERVVGHAHARWLADRLTTLPPVTQEVCLLAAQGADRTDVATTLGVSPRSVESHITRARRMLRLQGTLGWTAVVSGLAAFVRRCLPVGLPATTIAAAAFLLPGSTDHVPSPETAPTVLALPSSSTPDRSVPGSPALDAPASSAPAPTGSPAVSPSPVPGTTTPTAPVPTTFGVPVGGIDVRTVAPDVVHTVLPPVELPDLGLPERPRR